MRKPVASVFDYSLNGLLADPDTDFWTDCFSALDEHGGPDHDGPSVVRHPEPREEGRLLAHPDDGRRASTTIVSGDTAAEIDALRADGDGHIIVWGGVSLRRSLLRLDLVSSTPSTGGVLELHYRRPR